MSFFYRGTFLLALLFHPPFFGAAAGCCAADEHKSSEQIDFSSTELVESDAFKTGWGVVSLVLAEKDLYSTESGILKNFLKRGRKWERPAELSYFPPDTTEPTIEERVGVRVHGGSTRHRKKKRMRVYFRKEYGKKKLKAGTIFSKARGALRSFVIRRDNDLRPIPYNTFASPVSFEIAQRIGAEAPETVPVRYYLNGQLVGHFYLTEHLSEKNLSLRFGHKDFLYMSYKGAGKLPDPFLHVERVLRFQSPLTMDAVSEYVDIDNLVGYLFSTVFCATNDSFQGVLYRNNREAKPLWRWIVWDMDHSFVDYGAAHKQGKRPLWQQETFELILSDREYRKMGTPAKGPTGGDIRAVLFTRMLYDDPKFRQYVKGKVSEWLRNELSADQLQKLSHSYKRLLGKLYPENRDDFFKFRGEYVEKEFHRILAELPYWKG